MLIGREAELAVLERAVAQVLSGTGSAVLVSGEPGAGKTRLVAETGERARAAGMTVGWGVSPAVGAPPFLPWRAVLRATVPAAGALLEDVGEGDEDARLLLFEDVATRIAAVQHPVALVLDDLQWADVASRHLLRFLLRTLRAAPVLVLATCRDEALHNDPGLHAVLDDLAGTGEHLRLRGLTGADVARLAAQLGAPPTDAAQLLARTGGNPFLVEQLCAAPRDAELPSSSKGIVHARLAAVSQECRELLDVAAVAGRELELPLLAAALSRSPVALLPLVDEALAVGVLESTGTRPPGYRFRHDLLREALVDALPAAAATALHWRLGILLAQEQDRDDAAAHHLQAGVLAGEPAEAVRVTLRAADQAAARLAFERAAEHLAWAVQATPRPADSLLLLRLGEARLHAGDWEGGAEVLEQAAEQARGSGDVELLARAALGLGAGLGGFEVRMFDARQITLLEQAAEALPDDAPLKAFVLARLSVALAFVDAPARREALTRRAVAVAERCGDGRALAYALATRADVVAGPDHVEERLELGTRITELAGRAGDDELVLLGHRFRVVALLEAGRLAELDREIAAFARRAERYRRPIVRWYVPLFAGMRALMRGDLDAARRLADEAEAVGAVAGSSNAPMLANTLRLAVAREDGTLPAFAGVIRQVVAPLTESAPTMIGPYVVLGVLALAEHDLDEAARCLEAMAAVDFAADERDAEWLGSLDGAADLCVALGDRERGARVYELLRPYAGLLVVDGIAAACLCAVDEVLARLALLLHRPDEAAHHLAQALAVYQRVGMVLALRRVRQLLGAAPVPAQRVPDSGLLVRDGELWLLSYAGREVRLPDAKGLHDLAVLLAEPGREVHVLELTGAQVLAGAADDVLDEQARRAYRQRLRDLDDDLDDAERDGDEVRAGRARAERDALLHALAEATGLGGRVRGTANDLERARQAVRARFRHLLQRLEPLHPELARHLAASVRTGVTCCYAPEHPVRWQTSRADVRRGLTPPR